MRSAAARWLWAMGTVLLVGATGLATWRVTGARSSEPPIPEGVAATTPSRLAPGHDYYLHVKLIELTDRRPDGKAWDSFGGSGPDVRFRLTWHKNVIWTSNEKPDALIASWDLLQVDLKQIREGKQPDLVLAPNDLVSVPRRLF